MFSQEFTFVNQCLTFLTHKDISWPKGAWVPITLKYIPLARARRSGHYVSRQQRLQSTGNGSLTIMYYLQVSLLHKNIYLGTEQSVVIMIIKMIFVRRPVQTFKAHLRNMRWDHIKARRMNKSKIEHTKRTGQLSICRIKQIGPTF